MKEEQILEGYLRTLEKFGGEANKYRNKYKEIIKTGNYNEIKNLIIEIKKQMTKEYHNRINEAILECGDNYDKSKIINV